MFLGQNSIIRFTLEEGEKQRTSFLSIGTHSSILMGIPLEINKWRTQKMSKLVTKMTCGARELRKITQFMNTGLSE